MSNCRFSMRPLEPLPSAIEAGERSFFERISGTSRNILCQIGAELLLLDSWLACQADQIRHLIHTPRLDDPRISSSICPRFREH